MEMSYSFGAIPFGKVLMAATLNGLAYLAFVDDGEDVALARLREKFPYAAFVEKADEHQMNALRLFSRRSRKSLEVKLHLLGTDFQVQVWEALLEIPRGQLSTYGAIAKQIGRPKAFRAVGTAVGGNPIAFLVPCHRVLPATGKIGNYHWGSARKATMIEWEKEV